MLRRFLLIQSLMLWQGGFLFYSLIVVPIGGEIFTPIDQGFVTRYVTVWLNAFGTVTMLIAYWDATRGADPQPRRKRARQLLVLVNAFLLMALYSLHHVLTQQINHELFTLRDSKAFYQVHAFYLVISGIQWFLMLVYVGLTLAAWRSADRIVKLPTSSTERS